MPEPRVSVIMIVLNGDRFLAEAIDSVRAQTFQHWELVVVDDGSTDMSRAIARDFAIRDSRIRCVSHPDGANRGMSASRNQGLKSTTAPYVAFLDCDDVFTPNKLEEQIALLDAHPEVGVLYGKTRIWHSWQGEGAKEDFFYPLGVTPDQVVPPPAMLHVLLDNRAQSPTQCNAIMRREAVAAVGGFEGKFQGSFEDLIFYAKLLLTSPCYVSSREWALYRQHGSSHMARSGRAGIIHRARLKALAWLARYTLATAPARVDVLAHIAEQFAREAWQAYRPRRPQWIRGH